MEGAPIRAGDEFARDVLKTCKVAASHMRTSIEIPPMARKYARKFTSELATLGLKLHKSWIRGDYITFEDNIECANALAEAKASYVKVAMGTPRKMLQHDTDVYENMCFRLKRVGTSEQLRMQNCKEKGVEKVIFALLCNEFHHGIRTRLHMQYCIGGEYYVSMTHVYFGGRWMPMPAYKHRD